jgi:hypothetical protein
MTQYPRQSGTTKLQWVREVDLKLKIFLWSRETV